MSEMTALDVDVRVTSTGFQCLVTWWTKTTAKIRFRESPALMQHRLRQIFTHFNTFNRSQVIFLPTVKVHKAALINPLALNQPIK